MKKILMIGNTDYSIYIYRKELVQSLISKGYKVIISSPNGDRVPLLKKMGCEFIETNVSSYSINPLNEIKLLINYIGIIKENKPDVILTYTIKPNVYGGFASKITKTPYISNITGLGSAIENGGFLKLISILLLKISLSKAKVIFFQNESDKVFLNKKQIGLDNGILIPGSGVNLIEHQFEDYPTESNPLQFSFISRLKKEKGLELFIEAAKYFTKKHSDIIFNIAGFAGDEKYHGILLDLHEKRIINYWGKLLNVHNLIKQSHCIVHPTYYPEGMSNILLEGAATGRPLISTNQPGCAEIIDDGVNGFLIKKNDLNDLIQKIELFIKLDYDQKVEMGKVGRIKIEKEFSREIITNLYVKYIENYSTI